jgi:inner membrane protein
MDNLSHSVAGLAVGELTHRILPSERQAEQQRLRRRLLLISGALASNFPDLDLVLTPLLPEPLGYLLHHRGHTHTLLYALPQALLLWAILWTLWPSARRLLKESASARKGFAIAIAAGFLLHLMMDYLNSYGLHPFHPFDSRWFYGDMVFIVEPFFWVVFGIPMLATLRRRVLKACLVALLMAVLLYFTVTQYLSWTSFFLLALIACTLFLMQYRIGDRGVAALGLAVIISIGFVAMQSFASVQAKEVVAERAKVLNPTGRLLDVSLTSFPSNPVCWTYVSVERNETEGDYWLRRGIVSVAPGVMPASACPASLIETPVQAGQGPAIALLFNERGSLETLRALARENCHVSAWLRFARTPLLSGDWLSDLRFSSSPRGNFTSMRLSEVEGRECPGYIPKWGMPRRDLLEPPAASSPGK